jgi:hypothetical protein
VENFHQNLMVVAGVVFSSFPKQALDKVQYHTTKVPSRNESVARRDNCSNIISQKHPIAGSERRKPHDLLAIPTCKEAVAL